MALDFTHKTTYEVIRGAIAEVHAPTQPISVYVGRAVYPVIHIAHAQYVLDLAKMLTTEMQVDVSMSLRDFLTERLTPTVVARYQTTDIPLPDSTTRKYMRRVDVYDAEAEDGCHLAYTSVHTPEIRNDIHRLETLPDIVVSSTHRSLKNSLVAINGVFHSTRYYDHELYALDGNSNIQNCKEARVVVMDTTAVGGHTIIPLTTDYYRNTIDQDPRQDVYLELPKRYDLTQGTPILIIDGVIHPIDDTYTVVGQRRLKIHTGRMDLISEFLHNPNTVYTHDKDGRNADPYKPVEPVVLVRPSVVDRITQYLNTLEYFQTKPSNETRQAVVEYRPVPLYKESPDVSEKITYALTHQTKFTADQRGEALTAVSSLQYNKLYRAATTITSTLAMPALTSAEFIMRRVFSKHSFIALLHTTKLYRTVTPLIAVSDYMVYEKRGFDCPRGLALYNRHLAAPYKTLIGVSGQYSITVDTIKRHVNLYKTVLSPTVIASPYYDLEMQTPKHRLEMVELFTT